MLKKIRSKASQGTGQGCELEWPGYPYPCGKPDKEGNHKHGAYDKHKPVSSGVIDVFFVLLHDVRFFLKRKSKNVLQNRVQASHNLDRFQIRATLESHYSAQILSFAAMIQVFVTGGTFDKEYNYLTGELYFKDTHLSEMFQLGRCGVEIDIRTLMMVDSLEMRDEDRALIIHNCARTPSNRILITHGTDRMVQTARHLAEADIKDKTIVLTGAMIPYAFGTSSDGFFNLGSSLAFAQILPPGIYVVMNGRYFDWDKVRKNRQTGIFEELPDADQDSTFSI